LLVRAFGVGAPIAVERNVTPTARGTNMLFDVVWSGTHFLYSFWDQEGAQVLAIDCRP
jgi:hypothetical protein